MKNQNTELLWNEIKKMGNFSDTYYDKNIETDLRKKLGMPEHIDLNEASPEQLLDAFFEVMAPLSLMYEDILNLFEKCNANRSTSNIEIEFQSSPFKSTRFNIENFMHAKEVLQKVKEQQLNFIIKINDINILWHILPDNKNYNENEIENITFTKWKKEYLEEKSFWPTVELDFKSIAMQTEFSDLLLKFYEFWEQLFYYYKLNISDREKLGDYELSNDKTNLDSQFIFIERDHILLYILGVLYYIAENHHDFSEKYKNDVQKNLKNILSSIHTKKISIEIESNKKIWKEFLSLPVWEKRYEVYSIWVFTKIVSAFPNECMTYYVQNNKLIFPFSGARLSSVKLNEQVFDIWTELRTEAIVKPIGKSRKKAIQPDFSIIQGDQDNILNTLLVIECKQYKTPNIKNFSEAIIDYAANRPSAKVLLVDYGEVKEENIISVVKTIPTSRYDVFSECRPQSISAQNFTESIYKLVSQYANIFVLNNKQSMSFTLFWDGPIKSIDLDLHLHYKEDEGSDEVQSLSYSCNEISDAKYSGDIQNAPGVECIRVNNLKQGVYDLWVNNYSKKNFTDCQPVILVKSEEITQVIKLETKDQDDSLFWWHVLKIDTNSDMCYIINKLEQYKEKNTY